MAPKSVGLNPDIPVDTLDGDAGALSDIEDGVPKASASAGDAFVAEVAACDAVGATDDVETFAAGVACWPIPNALAMPPRIPPKPKPDADGDCP